MSEDTTPPPLTHAERGRLGGLASNPRKGFGSQAVSAKAVAKLRAQAEERRARVKQITDQYVPPAVAAVASIHVDTVLVRVPASYDVPIIE
jgi:hypothetical protein